MERTPKKTKVFRFAAAVVTFAALVMWSGCQGANKPGGSSQTGNSDGGNSTIVNNGGSGGGSSKPTYKVTLKKSVGGNVAVSPALPSDGMVTENTELTFTAAPVGGYKVEKWELNGEAVNGTEQTYKLKVSKKVDVKVFFIKDGSSVTEYTVTVNAVSNGKVTVVPEVPSDKKMPKYQELTVTATPDSGYVVEKWTVTPAGALQSGGTDGSTTATVTVTFKPAVTPPPASADETYTVDGVSFTMKGITAVTGGSVGHDDYNNNKPHTVSLTAYRIGETEVTQELWEKVMGSNPSFFDNTGNKEQWGGTFDTSHATGEVQGKRPVESVTWFQSVAFCNELTKKGSGAWRSRMCVLFKRK